MRWYNDTTIHSLFVLLIAEGDVVIRYNRAPRVSCLTLISVLFISVSGCATDNSFSEQFEALTPETIMEGPAPRPAYASEQVAHGKYIVELLGCASCHTQGALEGEPDYSRQLAGSSTGVAYSNPLVEKYPGIVYPANLTPDTQTGIGKWSDDQILKVVRKGVDPSGRKHLPVMPWPAYTKISEADGKAIVAYLRSLPSIKHAIPKNIFPGNKSTSPYVHFGVYRNRK